MGHVCVNERDTEREKERRLSLEMQESISANVVAEGLTWERKNKHPVPVASKRVNENSTQHETY